MKARTRKIGKVASLAAAEERRFGEQAGRSQRHLEEQRGRLGALNAFRHNYAEKKGDSSGAISSAHWKDYQDFLQRLDTAVKAQQQIVRDCEQNVAAHRQRWMIKRQKLDSLERVLEKYRAEDAVFEDRLEQKILDDLPNAQSAGFDKDET